MRAQPAPLRDGGGFAAVELVAGVGFLLLPTVLLVLSLPAWIETQSMGRVAAREAARTLATAPDSASADAFAAAAAAAATVAANHDRELAAPMEVATTTVTVPGGTQQEHVVVTVRVTMPVLSVPLVGRWGSFDRAVSHSEPLDRYRSLP